jgi:hypothetical protein
MSLLVILRLEFPYISSFYDVSSPASFIPNAVHKQLRSLLAYLVSLIFHYLCSCLLFCIGMDHDV